MNSRTSKPTKSYRISNTTRPYALRLSNKAADIIDKRASKRGIKVGEYIRKFLEYDCLRSHHKRK